MPRPDNTECKAWDRDSMLEHPDRLEQQRERD